MRIIHKHALKITDKQEIDLPDNAKILTVQVQHDIPYIWYEVDTEETLRKLTVYVKGTGHPLTEVHGKYLGTFQTDGGTFVFHVYIGVWK